MEDVGFKYQPVPTNTTENQAQSPLIAVDYSDYLIRLEAVEKRISSLYRFLGLGQ